MDRVEGKPVRFVVTKRFTYGGKIFKPGIFHDWDVRSFDELTLTNSDNILELGDNKEDIDYTEDINYEGKVDYMPIRFVVTKDFSYRGNNYYKEDIVDWAGITYEDYISNHKDTTKIIKMDTTDWIDVLTNDIEEVKEDVLILAEALDEDKSNKSVFSVLDQEKIDGDHLGGLPRDYYELKEVKKIIKKLKK